MKLDLRKLAKGQACQVHLPGCLCTSDTVVLAHVRRGGTAGMGQKPPDLCGIYACANCHNVVDGRHMLPNLSRIEVDSYVLGALCRTLAIVQRELDAR